MRKKMKVRVSVVLHRTPEPLLASLMESVLRSDKVEKIIMVDNSPDRRLEAFAATFPLTEYHYVENRGYGAGHNVALRESLKSDADYHLVVNPDVRWKGDVISEMGEFMDSHPEAGLSMPLTFYPDGKLQHSCRLIPTPLDLILRRFLPPFLMKGQRRRFILAAWPHDTVENIPYLLGSFMFFRLETLRRTGLFDERFFMYPEDIDMSRRVHAVSSTLFNPHTSIVHDHAAASRYSLRMLRIHIVNMIKYFNKWGWCFDRERREVNAATLRKLGL